MEPDEFTCGQAYDDGPYGVLYCTLEEGHTGRCLDEVAEEQLANEEGEACTP